MKTRFDPNTLLTHDAFVRRLARRLVGDAARADDLVQDTWAAALEREPSGEDGELRGWLATVVRRIRSKDLRSGERRRHRERTASRDEATDVLDEVLAREESRRLLVDAVRELPEAMRTAVLLRYFEGLPPRTIARRLDVSVETVKTRLKRGVALLRTRLDERRTSEGESGLLALLPLAFPRALPSVPPAPVGPGAPASSGAPGTPALSPAALTLSLASHLAVMSTTLKAIFVVVPLAGLLVLVGRPFSAPPSPTAEAKGGAGVAQELVEPYELDVPVAAVEDPSARESVAEPAVAPEVPAPVVAPSTGALEVLVRWSDGSPAEGIGVDLTSWSAPEPRFSTRELVTDTDGRILAKGLPVGSIAVYPERANPTGTKIVAGETAQVVVDIARGFDIDGIVVDEHGKPVAGADVWLSDMGWLFGRVVAKSDEDGTFFVRDWSSLAFVCARKAGYAPSMMPTLSGGEGALVPVELVLPGRGGAVAGRVVDPDGEPVEGATVWIDMLEKERAAGRFSPAPFTIHTDADGAFLAEGVQACACDVRVRVAGFAPWGTTVDVRVGETARVEAELSSGVTLTGTVRGPDGELVPGAYVETRWEPWEHGGRTDAEGVYRLENLPAGELEVTVETEAGLATTTVAGNAGDELRWDARLGGGLELTGVVVDEAGAPLVDWWINATAMNANGIVDIDGASTDAEGRFVIRGCVEVPYRLEVRAPDTRTISIVAEDVVPGDRRSLVVPFDRVPSAMVKGIVVHADGRPAGDAVVTISQALDLTTPIYNPNGDTGAFEIGPLPAGTWRLGVRDAAQKSYPQEPRELLAGETWDVGTIVVD